MAILVILLLVAALLDVWKGRIPNGLIVLGLFLGLCRLVFGQKQIYDYLLGMLIPCIILFPLFKIGTLGAGDIKLFSLIGAFLPTKDSFICILMAFFIGAALGLILLIKNKKLSERLHYFYLYLVSCMQSGRINSYFPEGEEGIKIKKDAGMSFALPILISTILVIGAARG